MEVIDCIRIVYILMYLINYVFSIFIDKRVLNDLLIYLDCINGPGL